MINLNNSDANTANDENIIFSAGDNDFQDKVLQASMQIPIIVDFWAPWCEPCKALGPILERLVRGAKGAIALAKVNVDENKILASQLRVQSIPMVYAFFQGQPIDAFSGNIGESQLKTFIDKILQMSGGNQNMQDIEQLMLAADEARSQKDFPLAMQNYSNALQHDPEHVEAIAGLLHCYIALGEADKAQQILETLPPDIVSNTAIQAVQKLLVLQQSTDEDISKLAKAAQDKNNLQARFDYACALFAQADEDKAMQELLDICQQDKEWNDGAARLKLLDFFEALGGKDQRVVRSRRRLSSMLFS